jgi:hypothetical protein
MGSDGNGPGWPTAAVALGFLAFVGVIFYAVYTKDGMDGATKAWALIGPVVGIVIGAIPSYFFHNTAVNAQKDAKAATLSMPNDPATIQRFRDLRSVI